MRDKEKRAEQYEIWVKQRVEGLDVSRSPSPLLTIVNLDWPSTCEYGNNEIISEGQSKQRDTVTPLRTFGTYTRERTPQNIHFDKDT